MLRGFCFCFYISILRIVYTATRMWLATTVDVYSKSCFTINFCQLKDMSVCSGKAYKPQLCRFQFTIPKAYYVMYLVWLIIHVAWIKIVLFWLNLTPPSFLHLSVFTHGVVYKVLAYSQRSTVVLIIGCLLIIEQQAN